ncbi:MULTISPECIES: hypothetical protein [unclassified Paenibacillus]|nr:MULTISPECIES: hypothetical protein [unclassified Paenibacillus]
MIWDKTWLAGGEASIRDLASYPSFEAPEELLNELDLQLAAIVLEQ